MSEFTNNHPLTNETLVTASILLAGKHKDLSHILEKYGPPPLWARRPGFVTLLQIILEQQVSLRSARAMFERLKRSVVPLSPERFLELGEANLRDLGLTRQKTAYCLHLSESIASRKLSLTSLSRMSDSDVRSRLTELKGIGLWSADVYLLMALRRPDVWPASDLALATAIKKLRRLETRPGATQLNELAESWRPLRSVAARMLWHYYLSEKVVK